MLSYSVSYSPSAMSRSCRDYMPSELVGVAGFEPAASSSRTKRAAKLRYTPPARNLTGTARDFDSLAEARACSRIARHSASQTPNGLAWFARRQGDQGGLRAAGEPGRGPRRRAQPGGNMQPGLSVGGVPVQAADSFPLYPAVGDQRAVERQAQLAAVSVPGEQEVVAVRREPVEQSRLG